MTRETPEYSILAMNERRLAVTHCGGSVVLGYVLENAHGTWSIELKGKIVAVLYGSLHCAARAILALNPVVN